MVAALAAIAVATPLAYGGSTVNQPRGATRAEDISNAIDKEQAAADWLDHTPPHIGDARRRLEEGLQAVKYAFNYTGDYEMGQLLTKAWGADEDALAVRTDLWPKSKIEEKIDAALVLKKKALKLERARDAGPTEGCTVSYPVPVTTGESTIGFSDCIHPIGAVKLTFPFGVAKVSSYAVIAPGTFDSGACTKNSDAAFCKLTVPWPPESFFFVAVSPVLQPGEHVTVDLTPPKPAQPWSFDVVVPAGPKLMTHGTAKEHTAGEATRRTAFDISLTISGGPFQNIVLDAPPGEHFGFGSVTKPTGGLSCGTQATAGGGQRTICTPSVGTLALPPGTYRFPVVFTTSLKESTKLTGSVAGTGVLPPLRITYVLP